jgi:hypothetical protein
MSNDILATATEMHWCRQQKELVQNRGCPDRDSNPGPLLYDTNSPGSKQQLLQQLIELTSPSKYKPKYEKYVHNVVILIA